jgi:isoleucyl-tRNA synthetase
MVARLSEILAPILSFTADEAWEFIPGKTFESVHEVTWKPTPFERPEDEGATWARLFDLRDLALPELEKARQAKHIGKALEAKLSFRGGPGLSEVKPHQDALRELLNVSQLEIQPGSDASTSVSVTKADGQKCERCWHWETDVGSNPEHPTICGRCVKAVEESTSLLNANKR